MLKLAASTVIALTFSIVGATAAAQIKYPAANVTMITHSTPGGGNDVLLREMLKYLPKIVPGTNFQVENVSGGGGTKAMAKLVKMPADGSYVYATTPTYINTTLLTKPDAGYQDFQGIMNMFLDPQTIYVLGTSPYKSLQDVIADAKKRPGKVKFGTTAPASLDRQVMEKLKKLAGIDVVIVTHEGGGDLLSNVLNGTVDIATGEVQEMLGQLQAGQVRMLSTYTKDRLANFPQVMTAQEEGLELVVNKFRGMVGPKGFPDAAAKAWQDIFKAMLEEPEFKAWYDRASLVPTPMDGAEYDAMLTETAVENEAFLREYGILK